ncbi:hypothetical protein G7Y89_g1558 [Cudoniella acicularis]|uniref:AB hydrolase-1 domain-containing protein n=1 Tax=Cudoniella acicularis TaxID=354080 RepID=A0A8H4W7A4_9HELO|nr:hypothetical protein G7Y89_g1558 [Cudoniella acicularis]
MVSTKPTLVLISSRWHTPDSYSKFTDALKSADFDVHVPALPSVNRSRPPNADLATDTVLVREYVENLVNSGHIIVAIMHSYGGQVGTNALHGLGVESRAKQGKAGGVEHLIYMCASALTEGGAMIDKVKEFGHEYLMPLAFDFAEDDSCVSRDPKLLLIGPGCDDAEVEAYAASFQRWNGKCMYQPITHCAWREIPVTYIYTLQDMTLPLVYQKSMVEGLQAEGKKVATVELDTGHSPNLTMTKGVVDTISKVVDEMPK